MKKVLLFLGLTAAAFGQSASYPSAVATDNQLRVAANNVQTTTTFPMLAADTTILVSNATGIVTNSVVTIDNEKIAICNVVGNTLTVGKSACPHVDGRAFDGTIAATHASGATAALNIDAWHHNALRVEIEAIETAMGAGLANVTIPNPLPQNKGGSGTSSPLTGLLLGNGASPFCAIAGTAGTFFRRKFNSAATDCTGYEFVAAAERWSNDYNFAAQQPGGTLVAGSNTITLTPCPPGVNGANASYYLYISGGTGAGSAEAVPVTGGTCTSGASSGTVVTTIAACGGGNCHTGAWTIQSAGSGISEAIYAGTSPGMVRIPAGAWNLYATVTKPSSRVVSIAGVGSESTTLVAQFAAGDALYVDGGSGAVTVRGLRFAPGVSRTSGAEVHDVDTIDGVIEDIVITGSVYSGVIAEDFIRTAHRNIRIVNTAFHGFEAVCASGVCGGEISDLNISASGASPAAIWIGGGASFAGMLWSNISAQGGQYNLFLDPQGGVINEMQFSNLQIDGATTAAFAAAGSTGSGNGLNISNVRASPSSGGQIFAIGKLFSDITISDVTGTKAGNVNGINVDGATGVRLSNISIDGSNNAGIADACINVNANSGQVSTNVSIVGVSCGRRNPPTYGLYVSANAHIGLRVADSDFFGTTPILDQGTGTTVYAGWVTGMSDTVPTVASAAALTFPRVTQGGTVAVTGNTGVTSVAGLYKGQTGFLRTTAAVAFTAGATIGTTVTTTANTLAPFWFDGTKIWLR